MIKKGNLFYICLKKVLICWQQYQHKRDMSEAAAKMKNCQLTKNKSEATAINFTILRTMVVIWPFENFCRKLAFISLFYV